VVDQDDLLRPEQPLGDRERPDRVVRRDAARVADHVPVALGEPEHLLWIEPGVHARQHCDPPAGGSGRSPLSNPAA
jgi:hypothetical protein